MISNLVNLYTNQTLVNSLITNPAPKVDSVVSEYLSGDFPQYKDTLEDYAEISQEAIDAYYEDVASEALNPQNTSNKLVYNSMLSQNAPKNKVYGLSAGIMLGYIAY